MTLRVVYESRAIDQLAGFLSDDPARVAAVLNVVDRLADEPCPGDSFPHGSPDLRCDSGHGILPGGGHEFCPEAAMRTAR